MNGFKFSFGRDTGVFYHLFSHYLTAVQIGVVYLYYYIVFIGV